MQRTKPCLWFDTRAEEAANFYVSVFANSRITGISYFGEAGPRTAGTVMTVEFVLDGQEYIALNGGPEFAFTEAVSFQISCASQEEVDYFWDSLTEGGSPGPCGWLKDKYGLSWQVVPDELLKWIDDPDPARSQAAMRAMLAMGKIDIAEVRRAVERGTA